MYGSPSTTQQQQIQKIISGRRVHDLGCGDCVLARLLLDWGATEVVAVDKDPFKPSPTRRGLTFTQAYFEYFDSITPEIDLAFMSWPSNRQESALLRLTKKAKTVVYLGKNTDGTMCGYPGLFEHFVTRKLLAYVPERGNTLIILGGPLKKPRRPRGEERAGLNVYNGKIYGFKAVEAGRRSKHI